MLLYNSSHAISLLFIHVVICTIHRRRLWVAARARDHPIIKMGGKTRLLPPIIRRELFLFFYLKKWTWKKAEERKIQRKGSKFWMKGVNFWKKLSMTKKSPQKFLRIEGDFFQNFFRKLSENIFSQNFCPPNICDPKFCPPIFMTSLRRWTECVSSSHKNCIKCPPSTSSFTHA